MSEQTPYETLQVSEDASFEEIQTSRDRLIEACQGDDKQRQVLEAAYDAILMDRLRRRQEGKIKVPERIRYAERLAEESPPAVNLPRMNQSPAWLQRLLDTPNFKEVAIVSVVYTSLTGLGLYFPTSDSLALLLALGFGFTLYWLTRKEQKLGRAFLLTLAGLVVGGVIATAILQVVTHPLGTLAPEAFVSLAIFVVLWVITCFLR